MHRCAAYRTGIPLFQSFKVNYHVSLVISAVVHIDVVVICLTGSCTKVLKARQLAVHYNFAVMKMHRAGEAAHTACCCRHLSLVGKLNGVFRNVESIYKLGHIKLSVSADKHRHIPVFISFCIVGHKEQCLDGLLLVQLKIFRNLIYSLGSRSIYLFQRQHLHMVLRRRIHTGSFFYSSCQIAVVAVGDFRFTVFTQSGKFVGVGAADGTRIRLNRTEVQSAAREYPAVGIIHLVVAFIQSRRIFIK